MNDDRGFLEKVIVGMFQIILIMLLAVIGLKFVGEVITDMF